MLAVTQFSWVKLIEMLGAGSAQTVMAVVFIGMVLAAYRGIKAYRADITRYQDQMAQQTVVVVEAVTKNNAAFDKLAEAQHQVAQSVYHVADVVKHCNGNKWKP